MLQPLFTALIAVLVATPSLSAQPAAETLGKVTGQVTDADTGAPVSGVRVSLGPVVNGGQALTVRGPAASMLTDADGRFAFDGVLPGPYSLVVQRSSRVIGDSGRRVDVTAGAVQTVDLTLRRGGTITGRVSGPDGQPLRGLRVSALRTVSAGGGLRASSLSSVGTDERGEFTLANLSAGEYLVVALPAPAPFSSTTAADGVMLAPTYFPGTTDIETARTLVLAPGETTPPLEFTMNAARAFAIAGVVVDAEGHAVADAHLGLMDNGPAGGHVIGRAVSAADGTFRLDAVAGSYSLQVMPAPRREGNVAVAMSFGTPRGVPVRVTDADVTGLKVVAPR